MSKMKQLLSGLAVCGMICAMSGFASAFTVLDQQSPYAYGNFNADTTSLKWQQEVVVGMTGQLSGIELYQGNGGTAGHYEFYINSGTAWQTDANDFNYTGYCTPGSGWNLIDLTSAGLYYNAGDTFVIGINGIGEGVWLGGNGYPGQYSPGRLLNKYNGNLDESDFDMAFRTYVNTVGTPMPAFATVMMLGTGLAGLAGRLRRKKH